VLSTLSIICNGESSKLKGANRLMRLANEAGVHCIITNNVGEVSGAVSEISSNGSNMVAVYGGDGTMQRVLTAAISQPELEMPIWATLGGGTMRQLYHFLGMKGNPQQVACRLIAAHQSGLPIPTREIATLRVDHNGETRYGMMFLLGPLVRLLQKYDQGGRRVHRAVITAGLSSLAAVFGRPEEYERLIQPAEAGVTIDGESQPEFNQFTGMVFSTIKRLVFGIEPFLPKDVRLEPGEFHGAVTNRPPSWIVRRLLRFHPRFRRPAVAEDRRFLNRPCHRVVLASPETILTVDGEIFPAAPEEPIIITPGPVVKFAVL